MGRLLGPEDDLVPALLFQLTPTDPAITAAAALLLALVGTCAGLLPAHRAARVDPATTLRSE